MYAFSQMILDLTFLDTIYAPLQASACIFFTPFFTAVYNQDRLILQTIYVLNKEILQ